MMRTYIFISNAIFRTYMLIQYLAGA